MKIKYAFIITLFLFTNCSKQASILNLPRVLFYTDKGKFTVAFYANTNRTLVDKFINNVKNKVYAGTHFHRVVKNFYIQGGDPNSKDNDASNDGIGGEVIGLSVKNKQALSRGSIALLKYNNTNLINVTQFLISIRELKNNEKDYFNGKIIVIGKIVFGFKLLENIIKKTVNNFYPLKIIRAEIINT